MMKKFCVFMMSVILCFSMFFVNSKPVLSDFANSFSLYLNDSSSCANIVKASGNDYFLFRNVCGESCVLSKEKFDIDEIFTKLNGRYLFSEETENGTSFYGFSEKIKYVEIINGTKVNIHISINQEQIVLGTPVIYGSF